MRDDQFDRALAAMLGVAIGDAMGMPSQTLSRERIQQTHGLIDDFRDAAPDQPVSAGLKAATITDDTEQTMLLARHLMARRGGFDEHAWASELIAWERDTKARGVNDLLGPSTKRAIDALSRGVPLSETGRAGTTNGAAMRIVPVAIATPAEPLDRLVAVVTRTCRLTHNTSEAIGAAAAVAAVVSAGIEGATFEDALPIALAVAGPVREPFERALRLTSGERGLAAAHRVAETVGTSVAAIESVAMAFAIVRLAAHDPWQAALLAANIGDDTDTIGAIACGMAAACKGGSALPKDKVERVVAVNHLEFEPVVRALLQLREVA